MRHLFLPLLFSIPLASCSSGNVRTAESYDALPPPAVQHPFYDPYAFYAGANATWRPPVVDRNGTIVKPLEPSTQGARPNYESAPWVTGIPGSSRSGPSGTF
jgi:hypothetical protein